MNSTQKQLQKIVDGKTPFVPVEVLSISMDAQGRVLVASQDLRAIAARNIVGPGGEAQPVPLSPARMMDFLIDAQRQLWSVLRGAVGEKGDGNGKP